MSALFLVGAVWLMWYVVLACDAARDLHQLTSTCEQREREFMEANLRG